MIKDTVDMVLNPTAGINAYVDFMNSLCKEELKQFAEAKRFVEMYTGDDDFRNLIETSDSANSTISLSQKAIFNQLKPLLRPQTTNFAGLNMESIRETLPYLYLWIKYVSVAGDFRGQLLKSGDSAGKNPRFDSWRLRNTQRSNFELGLHGTVIVHAPVVFELSDGCSVGCWFCGVSAEKFKGHFSCGNGGEEEWNAVLEVAESIVGSGLRAGFCYWATDPLDNPEYLELVKIYEKISGVIPQTTTAIPLKNIEKTKELLEYCKGKSIFPNRFSVLTKSILKKVHDNFSAEELLGVELVLQNNEALNNQKAGAGKANKYSKKNLEIFNVKQPKKVSEDTTIACVTGFLINVVKRNVRLISPTIPSEKYKDGFIVYDEQIYDSPERLSEIMESMIEKHMPGNVRPSDKVSFGDNVSFVESQDGICYLQTPNVRIEYRYSKKLAESLVNAKHTAGNLISELKSQGEDPFKTAALIETFWRSGFIKADSSI